MQINEIVNLKTFKEIVEYLKNNKIPHDRMEYIAFIDFYEKISV